MNSELEMVKFFMLLAETLGIDYKTATMHDYAKGIFRLKELVLTYENMPFPCHDHMSKKDWEDICHITSKHKK